MNDVWNGQEKGRITPFPRQGGFGSGKVDAPGILDSRLLPDIEFAGQWDAVFLSEQQKDRLLSQSILNFTLRSKVSRSHLPLHGLIVLHGPPGTGKTSLARGLASRTAEVVRGLGQFRYIEVEPHSLASASLGKSQKAVRELLGETIAEQADRGPLIVLLDEVETLAADRSKMSMEANPIDVHRATDAVLAQLDQLASRYPQLLFLATSNFTNAVDAAFLSRADLIENVGLPNPHACEMILRSAIEELAKAYPNTSALLHSQEFKRAAEACVGLDGRRIRKLVVSACAVRKETAIDPNRLTTNDLLRAVEQANIESKALKGSNV